MNVTESELRGRVVVEARAWLGTPYHHHARLQGIGVDCAHLLAAVFEAGGLVPPQELGNYSPQWHLHHSEELYLQALQRAGARRLPFGSPVQPGDVLVWRFGRTYSHGGIAVTGGADPEVVHAYIDRGVILSRLSEAPLSGRLYTHWSLF